MLKRPFDDPRLPAISRRRFAIALRALFPACPPEHRGRMVDHLVRRVYRGRLMGVTASVVHNWIRHNLTVYNELKFAPGDLALDRDAARQMVAPEVAAIVAAWRKGGAHTDPAFRAVRKQFHRRRLKEGVSPALTHEENSALVDELSRWLERRGELVSRHRPERSRSARAAARAAKENGPVPDPLAEDVEEPAAPAP